MDDTTRDGSRGLCRVSQSQYVALAQRFYDFIIGEAGSRSAAGVSEVEAFLVEQGLLREEARLWALRYDFGLGLLRRFRDVPR